MNVYVLMLLHENMIEILGVYKNYSDALETQSQIPLTGASNVQLQITERPLIQKVFKYSEVTRANNNDG